MRNFRPAVSVLALSIAVIGPEIALAQQSTGTIEEMVVTAQRREQKLSEVPMSITALGAKDIEQRSITSFTDYATSVPSMTFAESGGFGNELKIRGIGAGTNSLSPTVAVYLGEVPVIHTARNAGSSYDFRVVDIQRIEVLNGPQGQLYGSNSLGGAVKYIPVKPKFGKFSGTVSVDSAHVQEGTADYDVQAALNIPLGENLAARLVGYEARSGGYYDNVFTGGRQIGGLHLGGSPFAPTIGAALGGALAGVYGPARAAQILNYQAPANQQKNGNEMDITGGRVIFDLRATENLDVELMLATEHKKWDGASYAENLNSTSGSRASCTTDVNKFEYCDLANSPGKDQIDLANFLINYDFGFAMLTSSTSYWKRKVELSNDLSAVGFVAAGNTNVAPLNSAKSDEPKSFTQEFRITSQGKGPFQWLAGIFYNEIKQDYKLRVNDLSGGIATDIVGFFFGSPGTPDIAYSSGKFKDKQTAIFGEAKYQLLDTLNASYSFRSFELKQHFEKTQGGLLSSVGGAPFSSSGDNTERIFTPKYQLTWTPEKGSVYYATASKGFRTGVSNAPTPVALCGPFWAALGLPVTGVSASKSDTAWNYELGSNLALAQNRVQVNATVYRIDWSNMQAAVFPDPTGSTCPFASIVNVGDVQSKGLELKVTAKVSNQLSLDFAGSYNDTKYKTDAPLVGAKAGDTVQMSPRYQTNVGVQYNYKLANMPSFARLDWNYVGEMQPAPTDFPTVPHPPFAADPLPVPLGNYSVINARLGWSLTDTLSLDVYGRNLTDKRGATFAQDLGGAADAAINYIRPRTLGANLRLDF